MSEVTDPYLWLDVQCLRNKLNIKDAVELRLIEARIVSVREVELATDILPGVYNLEHLQRFHRHLFQDIYDWAGVTRTVDISKSGSRFAHWRYIDDSVSAILANLENDGWLTGRSRESFLNRLAYYYGELNVCHPFRDGNGRAQRAFLRQLAAGAGWRLDWSELDRDANNSACAHNLHTGKYQKLIDVLSPVVSHI